MPLTVPPFTQFQGTLFPLRGLWNATPAEGDRFINAEIDWGSQNTSAVQFSLSGNSPVALSQIVALYVDNRRCGVDADFLFPDSGFLLTVPGRAQGLFPVLTNSLMFYCIAQGAASIDVTILQVLNSLPPPIPLLPSSAQTSAGVSGINAGTNATTPIIASTISGTINSLSINLNVVAPAPASLTLQLIDGTGAVLWLDYITVPTTALNIPINLSGLNLRFRNGVSLVASNSGGVSGGSADSSAAATRYIRSSAIVGAITCSPTGSPSESPQGTEMAGPP